MVFVGFEYLMEIHVSEVGRPSKNNEGEGSKHYHQRGHCWQHNPHRSFEMCYESYESKIHSGRQSSGSEVRRAMADFVGMLAQWCAELSLLWQQLRGSIGTMMETGTLSFGSDFLRAQDSKTWSNHCSPWLWFIFVCLDSRHVFQYLGNIQSCPIQPVSVQVVSSFLRCAFGFLLVASLIPVAGRQMFVYWIL